MEQKFNYYDLGPRVVEAKPKYREGDSKKLTYNFVTDPRLRRGHNYGLNYVTSSNYDDDTKTMEREGQRRKQNFNKRSFQRSQEERGKREASRRYDPNSGFGICTEKVTTTVRPRPITFEVEVQTDKLPPKEQEKLVWPSKTGIDVETQIEDGELFNFDEEVKPIVHVIVSKVIEESRREVLEEEERAEIKEQQLKYEELNKQDEERVRAIENQERLRFEERKRKKEEKQKRVQLTKIFQKKLVSRTLGKKYLANLVQNTVGTLGNRGVFKKPEVDEYFTEFLPDLQEIAESEFNVDRMLSGAVQEILKTKNNRKFINRHKAAIERERDRIRKEKEDFLLKKKLEEEERQRQKEERRRRRHEKLLNQLREQINEELLVNKEFVEYTIDDIYDINGYYQKTKSVTCVGGSIGQMAFVLNELNKITPEFITDDKIPKILELYLPKSHPFFFLYKPEDIEQYKAINEEIAAIEDIVKCEDEQFPTVLEKLYENSLKNDDMLQYVFAACKEVLELEDFEKMYRKIFDFLLNKFKEGSDGDVVKFIELNPETEEVPLTAICSVKYDAEVLPDPNASSNGKAAKKPVKVSFDPYFSEKTLLMPTISDKIKIILINENFDRIFRDNFLECINKIYTLEPDKETYTAPINEDYDKLVKGLLITLGKTYEKEIVEFTVATHENEEEEKEEEEEGDKDKGE